MKSACDSFSMSSLIFTEPAKPAIISSPVATPSPKTSLPQTYTVQTGDALETLAIRFCGNDLDWRDLVIANRSLVGRQNDLEVGEKLNIPTNCKGK